ncbi:MAG: tetratricopeptide repeat protein, partial [Ktedonobacteraceae bacterium]
DNPAVAVLEAKQSFPDDYQFGRVRAVIAGRNAPQWSHPTWQGREQDVLLCPLTGFSLSEAREYLVENAPTRVALGEQPGETVQALHAHTEGRPILLALLVDILHYREVQLAEIVEISSRKRLEEALVQWLHLIRPIDQAIYFMAHIAHRFDERILETIASIKMFPPSELTQLFASVSRLSVVRTSSSQRDVLVLHDEMRRMVNDYCWPREDPTKSFRSELSTLMIGHYNARLATKPNEELRESYLVEKLFHELFLDIDAGLASFSEQFRQALRLSQRAFARSLLREVKKFDEERLLSREKQPQLSLAQRQDLKVAEARLLVAEENPSAALLIYQELERDLNWVQSHASDLLFFRGDCYFHTARYAEAIDSFEACLQLERANSDQTRTAEIYNALGLIARRQARYREARDY